MNENLFININKFWLKFHQLIHDTNPSICTSKYSQKDILGFWGIACCKRTLTLARQIWRPNYVIGRNEYLISTLLESTVPWVYSLQFLFKSTHHLWRYERNCEWVFFSEHSVFTFAPHYLCCNTVSDIGCKLMEVRRVDGCYFHIISGPISGVLT